MKKITKTYTIRLDETDKQRADQVFRELGMTFATGMNLYVKMVGRHKKIPFNLDVSEQIPKTLKESFGLLQEEAKLNGIEDMTMDEIDAEIAEYRHEKRGN
jgi:DNA-damage-inducible protein J